MKPKKRKRKIVLVEVTYICSYPECDVSGEAIYEPPKPLSEQTLTLELERIFDFLKELQCGHEKMIVSMNPIFKK